MRIRLCCISCLFLSLFVSASAAERIPTQRTDPARLARIRVAPMPTITRPVLFHTAEADAILSALEVFPTDHAFNQVIED